VFTVCDSAAAEVWPGQPMSAHWGVEDPAAFAGSEETTLQFFRRVYGYLEDRIRIFSALPIAALERMTLKSRLDQIGQEIPSETGATP
jgi:arsenate reductase